MRVDFVSVSSSIEVLILPAMSSSIRKTLEILFILSITLCTILAQEERHGLVEIKNKTHIHCTSESSEDVTMFTSPPLNKTKVQHAENLLKTGIWKNDDWITKESTDLASDILTNVLDSRWEDFEIEKFNYHRFNGLNISLSFSVYGTQKIDFAADDGESLAYFTEYFNNSQEWTTFTIFMRDDHINFYNINEDYTRKYLLTPTQILMKTSQEAYLKIHKYEYKEATSVTKEGPTSLTIPQSEKSYLILFVSLCKSCVLEVEYGDQKLSIFSNIKENNNFEQWQTYKVKLDSSMSNEVKFIRKHYNKTDEGYWRLDVRLDNEKHTAAYKVENEIETYHCKYVSQQNDLTRRRQRDTEHQELSADFTECEPGMVGTNCDISCASVLGKQFSFCKQHKICLNSTNCKCAWGYYGNWCENECDDGKWGINCQNKCQNCTNCNKQTGKCSDRGIKWIFWVVLFGVVGMVVSGILYFRKKQSSDKSKQNKARLLKEQELV